jgi:8-oxo-dGTP diphosphatase
MDTFTGSKVALLHDGKLVAIQRDNLPGLRFAGLWDFPGGGREDDETPEACAIREVQEELHLTLTPDRFIYRHAWPAMHDPSLTAWFLVAPLTAAEISHIILGDEGRQWQLISIKEFFSRDDFVPQLKPRLQAYLDQAAR